MTYRSKWSYGGHLLKGQRAALPVVSNEEDHSIVMFSSRDSMGRSYGLCSSLISLFPPKVGEPRLVLKHGNPGSFDVAGVMPMQSIEGYLFYIGWTLRKDVPYFNYSCISEKRGNYYKKIGPILGPDIYESGFSSFFHAVKYEDRYLGYYLSVIDWSNDEKGNLNPNYDIKIAESNDLINWKRLNLTAISLNKDEAGIGAISIIKHQKIFHAWFSVRKGKNFRDDPSGGYRIEHATSHDGILWSRDKNYSIMPGDFVGSEKMAAYPSVYIAGESVIIFFNGNGFGEDGIFWCHMPLNELLGANE